MNYLVENNYTEETKSFLTECQAYKFDAEDWMWRETKIKVA